jgi:hypothetical protein
LIQTLQIAQQRILRNVDPEAVESAVVMPADATGGATQVGA